MRKRPQSVTSDLAEIATTLDEAILAAESLVLQSGVEDGERGSSASRTSRCRAFAPRRPPRSRQPPWNTSRFFTAGNACIRPSATSRLFSFWKTRSASRIRENGSHETHPWADEKPREPQKDFRGRAGVRHRTKTNRRKTDRGTPNDKRLPSFKLRRRAIA